MYLGAMQYLGKLWLFVNQNVSQFCQSISEVALDVLQILYIFIFIKHKGFEPIVSDESCNTSVWDKYAQHSSAKIIAVCLFQL